MKEELVFSPADDAIAHWVLGFVRRRNGRGGDVVFELPELRPSIQVMLGDDYWLRGREETARWQAAPRIALWGPRLTWGFGYARRVVHAYGIGLTPEGVMGLAGRPVSDFIDRVVDLSALCADVADEIQAILSSTNWDAWNDEATVLFRRLAGAPPAARWTGADALADGGSVRSASDAAGVGDRHFRRRFRTYHGLSPRQYRRLLRVDRMLKRLHPKPWEVDTFDAEPAFADQPHMIREFKALTGVTPREYVRCKARHGDLTLRSVVAAGIAPPPT